mmetsp:Transcript_7266/g.14232  ORF Transcript_7266/g.14232 Transcript_7266/m.14232 type:complete len:103 (+) Transcript_7266:213-521(+)
MPGLLPRYRTRYHLPIWKYVNWWTFLYYKESFYNVCFLATKTVLYGMMGYLAVSFVYVWNDSLHRTWSHFVRKEKERAELMELIRKAREEGILPPSKVRDFQ